MWNVRSVLRSVGIRLKTSVNGNAAQSTREGCSELEDEYKHLWVTNVKNSDAWSDRLDSFGPRNRNWLFRSNRHSTGRSGNRSESERENNEWDASRFPTNRSWVEALGWGAVLGLGFQIIHPKQEEFIRKRCPVEKFKSHGFSPERIINRICALSMPLPKNNSFIKSVVSSGYSFGSSSGDFLSESEELSELEKAFSDDMEGYERPVYTPESSAMMSLLRNQLKSIADEYVTELQILLGQTPINSQKPDRPPVNGQEEYNLGLFHELGIGVKKNTDEAVKHYVDAAFLGHPIAIENLVALHKYSTVPSGMHRSFSNPVLSTAKLFVEKSPVQGKFWSEESSDSGASSISRSTSFPDLPSLVPCK